MVIESASKAFLLGQRMLASLPMSNDVIGVHAWALEKGMPESCEDVLLLMSMGLLLAASRDVPMGEIRSHMAGVIDQLAIKGDITTMFGEVGPGRDALAFADFAVTFLVERGCSMSLVMQIVDRFLMLLSEKSVTC